MTAYAIIVTLVLGMFIGTVIERYLTDRQDALEAERKNIHPSTRDLDVPQSTILDYPVTQ